MKAFCLVMFLLASVASAEVTSVSIKPSLTDPEIKNYDEPHWIYVNRDIVVDRKADLAQDRHELLLWIPGTGSRGHDAQGLANLAADLGYHVVTLMYPDDTAASACADDGNPKAFEQFRMAIIEGGDAAYRNGNKTISIPRPESIENRLIKLLQHLHDKRPLEQWAQFLNPDGSIKWESIAVAGQSQGGGHAALIGVKHKVERVLCFGSPKDYSKKLKAPAAWYAETSATPKGQFFAFNHHQDPNTCTPEEMLANLKALGLETFGKVAEVDTETAPCHHAAILYTSYPPVTITGPESDGAKTAHGAAISTKNAERWKDVWTYMLTEQRK